MKVEYTQEEAKKFVGKLPLAFYAVYGLQQLRNRTTKIHPLEGGRGLKVQLPSGRVCKLSFEPGGREATYTIKDPGSAPTKYRILPGKLLLESAMPASGSHAPEKDPFLKSLLDAGALEYTPPKQAEA